MNEVLDMQYEAPERPCIKVRQTWKESVILAPGCRGRWLEGKEGYLTKLELASSGFLERSCLSEG